MSTFRRWKEERIRHHIYLDQLKTAQNFSDGAALNGVRFEKRDGSSGFLLQEQLDTVRDGRTSTSLTLMMIFLFIGYGFLGLVLPTTAVLSLENHGAIAARLRH